MMSPYVGAAYVLASRARQEEITRQLALSGADMGPASTLPPERLSLKESHADFHPCYPRVGVLLDGVERHDVEWYSVKLGRIRTIRGVEHDGKVQVFWRYAETRQQRRARERWEAKRGTRA